LEISEENQDALGDGRWGQNRLTEISGSSNDDYMKRVFETAECEEVTTARTTRKVATSDKSMIRKLIECRHLARGYGGFPQICDPPKIKQAPF